jgi:hypothetical protein
MVGSCPVGGRAQVVIDERGHRAKLLAHENVVDVAIELAVLLLPEEHLVLSTNELSLVKVLIVHRCSVGAAPCDIE